MTDTKLKRAPRGSSERVSVPFGAEELAVVREAARAAGYELGAWIRLQAVGAAEQK